MSALDAARDERGTTMVELLVGMAMGMIVLGGLSMTIIVVLHGSARVSARVEATHNARIDADPDHRRAALGLHLAEDRAGARRQHRHQAALLARRRRRRRRRWQPIPVQTKIELQRRAP